MEKRSGCGALTHSGQISIDRPADDTGCLTFYRAGSKKGKKAGIANVDSNDMGVISVEFRPEKKSRPKGVAGSQVMNIARGQVAGDFTPTSDCCQLISAGGTGLSGKSNQEFHEVPNVKYNQSDVVTINLRLVEGNESPRELMSQSKSNSVPRPV